jgi:hypothetical protein
MSLLEFDRVFASTEAELLCQPTLRFVGEASSLVRMKIPSLVLVESLPFEKLV